MRTLVSRINSYYDGLSKADQKISDFLLENIDSAARLSIQEFAEEISVSTATISRYAKKIGFNSFQELKLAIHATDQKQENNFFSELSPDDSNMDILNKSFKSNISSLNSTLQLISEKDLQKSLNLLLKADTVGFFGLGGSNTIANLAFHKFIRMPVKTVFHQDFHYQQMLATKLTKHDCAFVISHTGRNRDTMRIVEILKNHKVPIIGITSFANSALAVSSDIALVSVSEEISFRPEAVASTVSQISILDAISMMYGMQSQDQTDHTIQDIRETIKKSRL